MAADEMPRTQYASGTTRMERMFPRLAHRASSLVGRLPAGLVVGDRGLECALFGAAEHAELVEAGEMLLGLLRLVEHEVGLADILVRAEMLGIDLERNVVVLQR